MGEINWDEVVDYVQKTGNKDVWKKLSEVERPLYLQALDRWQKSGGNREVHRPDNSLLGLPPELAAVGLAPRILPWLAGGAAASTGQKTLSNLSQKTSTEAVAAGEGPSGGARGLDLRGMTFDKINQAKTAETSLPGPSNLIRTRSLQDEINLARADGASEAEIRRLAHQAVGAQSKGVVVPQARMRSPKK